MRNFIFSLLCCNFFILSFNNAIANTISGDTLVCFSQITKYSTQPDPTKKFEWKTVNAKIKSGQNTSQINVAWDTTGLAEIWLVFTFNGYFKWHFRWIKIQCANISIDKLELKTLKIIANNWTEIKELTVESPRHFTKNYSEVIALSVNKENKPNGIFIGTKEKGRFMDMIKKLKINWDYRSDEDENQ